MITLSDEKRYTYFHVKRELAEKLDFIASVTGQTRMHVLEDLVDNVFSISATFRKCTFEIMPLVLSREIRIKFFGSEKDSVLKTGAFETTTETDEQCQEKMKENLEKSELGK